MLSEILLLQDKIRLQDIDVEKEQQVQTTPYVTVITKQHLRPELNTVVAFLMIVIWLSVVLTYKANEISAVLFTCPVNWKESTSSDYDLTPIKVIR